MFSLLFMGCPEKTVFVDLNVYSISGTVSNSSSAALSGVKVYTSPATNTVYTDASGNYSITSIAAGTYTVYAELTGYVNYSASVTVTQSQAFTQNISMTLVALPVFVFVQGGTYTMGSSSGDSDELPLHSVALSSYYITKTEVTQGQYKAVMGTNPSNFSSVGDNAPVEKVTWYDCISYCNKLSIQQGKTPCYSISGNTNPSSWTSGTIVCDFTAKGYRLATEAEWEYASIGGNKSAGNTYSGGITVDDVAWHTNNSGGTTHMVGTKIANELGINDMSGNVWEWCWDWYSSYTSSTQTNPTGASSGSSRVLRGGSWNSYGSVCRSSNRNYGNPVNWYSELGFRLVQGQ